MSSFNPIQAFYLRGKFGRKKKTSMIQKFGQNSDLNSTSYEDIWDGGGDYPYPADDTAPITKLVSTVAGDTEPIEVQGLDVDGNLVLQTITLTGDTAVALTTPLWRVFRLKNQGSSDLVGDVTVTNDAGDVTYAKIAIGNNQTLMALYTIPAGKTGFLLSGTNNLSDATRAVGVSGRLAMRPYGGVFQLKKTFGLNSEGTSFIRLPSEIPGAIGARTDIRVSAIASANGVSLKNHENSRKGDQNEYKQKE